MELCVVPRGTTVKRATSPWALVAPPPPPPRYARAESFFVCHVFFFQCRLTLVPCGTMLLVIKNAARSREGDDHDDDDSSSRRRA